MKPRIGLQRAGKQILLILLSIAIVGSLNFAFADEDPSGFDMPKKPRAMRRKLGEFSAMGGFSRADYGGGTYSKSRRFTISAAYYLTLTTQIEAAYSDSRTFYNSSGSPNSTTDTWDRNLSLSINQALLPPDSLLQPFVKAGAAQVNRIQSITYEGVQQPDSVLKQPSGVLGAGVRIYLTGFLALRFEMTSYLPNFHISAAKENYDWEAGLSYQF